MAIENKQLKHLRTTYSDSVHPPSVLQAAVLYYMQHICSIGK